MAQKNFPKTITEIKDGDNFNNHNITIDNLCLDMNGIFHNCAQKVYQYGAFERKTLLRKTIQKRIKMESKFYKSVCETIEHYKQLVNPKKD